MLLSNEVHRLNKTTEDNFASISTWYSILRTTILYSYTQKYNNNVSQFIYLQKPAVLPSLSVKSLVYLNKSCTTSFRRRGYGSKEKDSSMYFCRTTIPAFHAGNLKRGKNCRTAFSNLT